MLQTEAVDRLNKLIVDSERLQKERSFEDAIRSLEEAQRYALELKATPAFMQASNRLGMLLIDIGRFEEGVACFQKALAHDEASSDTAALWINQGSAFARNMQFDKALACFDRAIAAALVHRQIPLLANAIACRGGVLLSTMRPGEAFLCAKRGLELDPKSARNAVLLGDVVLHNPAQDYDERIVELLEKATEGSPNTPVLNQLVRLKWSMCSWDGINELMERAYDSGFCNPSQISMHPDPLKQRACIEEYVRRAMIRPTNAEIKVPVRDKIRIGYMSNDFHAHATMYLFLDVLEAHDRSKFEVYTLSYGPRTGDEYQQRAIAASDRHIQLEREKGLTEKIRELELDILVDLKGWVMNSFSGVLADRVAPIQVTWLGYPGTSGISSVDYILGDAIVTPKGSESWFTEKVTRLPYGYQPNGKPISYPLPTRAEHGLPEEGIVFGAFHQAYKITPECFGLWMSIMKQVPGSVLWVLKLNETAAKNLRMEAERLGVSSSRLVFAPFVPRAEHLARLQLVDVGLDTPRYNGHTTTSDALQMGVLVVTKCGRTFASRVSASLLLHLNMSELITHTDDEYEQLVMKLATGRGMRERLKSELKGEVATSPIYQPRLFAQSLEQAFAEMVRRHRAGLAPDHIELAVSGGASA